MTEIDLLALQNAGIGIKISDIPYFFLSIKNTIQYKNKNIINEYKDLKDKKMSNVIMSLYYILKGGYK